jgi:hypothetical protein
MFFMSSDIKALNGLLEMYSEFAKVPVLFKERVCEECNYSTPTFYRKMRGIDRRINGKLVQVLSKAEQGKIREIAEEVTNGLFTSIFGGQEK